MQNPRSVVQCSITGGNHLCLHLLLTFILLLVACSAPSDTTWRRIEEEGVLRVGLDPTYPPFAVAEGDQVRGFDVDLARALAAHLGLEAHFTYFGYDGLYDALATEQVDVLISALVIRPEQTGDFAYSEPYFNAGQIMLVPAGEREIETMADLEGRTLAVELGSQGHYDATQWQRRVRDLTLRPYPSPDEALAAVAAAEADAGLVDSISGRLFLREHDTLRLANSAVTVEPFAMVVRIEDEKLLANLNEGLETLAEDGQLQEIHSRWLYP